MAAILSIGQRAGFRAARLLVAWAVVCVAARRAPAAEENLVANASFEEAAPPPLPAGWAADGKVYTRDARPRPIRALVRYAG